VETVYPNMALVRVSSTSVTSSQNVIFVSAEPALNILSTILPSETFSEEINTSRILKISKVKGKVIPLQARCGPEGG